MTENRRHPRSVIDVPVAFALKGSQAFVQGVAINISIGGIYIETAKPAEFGAEVVVRIPLRLPTNETKEFDLPGTVRWVRDEGMGVQFGLLGAIETHGIVELCRLAAG